MREAERAKRDERSKVGSPALLLTGVEQIGDDGRHPTWIHVGRQASTQPYHAADAENPVWCDDTAAADEWRGAWRCTGRGCDTAAATIAPGPGGRRAMRQVASVILRAACSGCDGQQEHLWAGSGGAGRMASAARASPPRGLGSGAPCGAGQLRREWRVDVDAQHDDVVGGGRPLLRRPAAQRLRPALPCVLGRERNTQPDAAAAHSISCAAAWRQQVERHRPRDPAIRRWRGRARWSPGHWKQKADGVNWHQCRVQVRRRSAAHHFGAEPAVASTGGA